MSITKNLEKVYTLSSLLQPLPLHHRHPACRKGLCRLQNSCTIISFRTLLSKLVHLLSLYLFTIYLSIYQSIYLSIYLPIYLSFHHLSIYQSIYLSPSIHLCSISLSIHHASLYHLSISIWRKHLKNIFIYL